MFSRKLVLVLIVVAAIGGFVLGACSSPTPAPAAPTAVSQQPAAQQPAPAQQTGNWCGNVKIVFFPGGPQG
ncbi:MAG: hypothetical protein ACM3JD_16385, partial [Rudaea sp.]